MIKKAKFILLSFLSLLLTGVFAYDAHAVSESEIMDVVKMQELYDCYTSQNLPVRHEQKGEIFLNTFFVGGKTVELPTGGLGHAGAKDDVTCQDLIAGGNGLPGIIPHSNRVKSEEASQFLEELGYTSATATNSQCFTFTYTMDDNVNKSVPAICVNGLANGGIITDQSTIEIGSPGSVPGIAYNQANERKALIISCVYDSNGAFTTRKTGTIPLGKPGSTVSQYANRVIGELKGLSQCAEFRAPDPDTLYPHLYKLNDHFTVDDSFSQGSTWALDPIPAANSIISSKGSAGWKGIDDVKFTPEQRTFIHQWYLVKYYQAKITCEGDEDFDDQSDAIKDLNKISNIKSKACYLTSSVNSDKPVRGVGEDLKWHTEYRAVFALLNAMSEEDILGASEAIATAEEDSDGEDDEEAATPTCYNSGGAKSLGWIVCAVMDWLSSAANDIYTRFVVPALRVDTRYYNQTSATKQAWNNFRDIANVVFIVLFLIVIFSQITGIGIDNYGIKKILPKLVVVAVLINLSYLICEICVDLSNILGNVLQTMFNNFSPTVEDIKISTSTDGNGTVPTAITGVAIAGVLFAGGVAIWSNPAIVLSLFVGLLGILIAVLFVFLLFAARKAAIIVLIILSPLAVVCYALPNTKSFFDRWKQLFQSLLLVYPIAGLLIGGGDFVSRVMLSNIGSDINPSVIESLDNFVEAFIAMIIGVVPIFFIPSVLKSSLNAIGRLSDRITGVGSSLKRGTGNAVRNSLGAKEFQSRSADWHAYVRGRGIQRRLGRYDPSQLTKGQRERLRRADEAVLARQQRVEQNRLYTDRNYVEGQRRRQEMEARNNAADTQLYSNERYIAAQNTKQANARTAALGEANAGVIELDQATADERARSERQRQELRNYQDQYSALTDSEMETEFVSALNAYAGPDGERNEENATRLSAAIQSMEGRGLHKEMMNSGLQMTSFQGSSRSDAMITSQFASSRNQVLSEYGKSRGKNANQALSLREFTRGRTTAGAPTGSGDSLAGRLADKGSNALVGMDDDTLEYIKNNAADSVSTEMLIKAATSTTNTKELTQINEMLQRATDTYNISPSELAKLNSSTVNALISSSRSQTYKNAVMTLWNPGAGDAERQIINSMDAATRSRLAREAARLRGRQPRGGRR